MKGHVKVAYWDTEQGARTPSLLGQIRGTPTIKLFVPKRKKNKNNRKKNVLDYNFERDLKSMKRFVEGNMPSFVEKVQKKTLDSFKEKAKKYGLPIALVFSKSSAPKPLLKFASTEYRRRLLVGQVNVKKDGASELMETFGVKTAPKIVILPAEDGEPVKFEKKISHHKLLNFFGEHALKDPVHAPKKEKSEM